MRAIKSGAPAVPKLVWKLLADSEHAFALELMNELKRVDPEVKTPMAKALLKIIERHIDTAETIDRIAENTRRGRPKDVKKHPNALCAALGIPAPPRAPGKPGLPTNRGPAFDLQTYFVINHVSISLAEISRGKPSIKAAIDWLNVERARDLGKRESTFKSAEYASLRACYQRGKHLAAKFQNPV